MPERNKGQNMFNVLSSYLETKCLSWENSVVICSDGAPSVVGSITGFASLVEKENPHVVTTHCFIHIEELLSKPLGGGMKEVSDVAIKIIKFIKDQFTPQCLRNCLKTWTKSI
jgi:hypothetical protein